MTVQKHGHQPAQRLGWATLVYHKQKDATPHPEPCKHCLHNDGKSDERLGVRLGTWNVDSMSGRGTEVCEELRKRRVNVCCLQEMRWRGRRARFMGVKGRRYKLWWSGYSDGMGGVGVLVKELCEKVVEVRRKSDRVMTVVMTLKVEVVKIICMVHKVAERVQRKSIFMMI